MKELDKFLEILHRKLKWKEKEFQDSIQYWKDNPDVWSEDDILKCRHYLGSIKLFRMMIEEATKELEHQSKLDDFVEAANDILDRLKQIADNKKYS